MGKVKTHSFRNEDKVLAGLSICTCPVCVLDIERVMDWQAAGLAALFAVDAALLVRRFRRRGNWLITSALMPRLYLALIFGAVAMGALSLTERIGYLRVGVGFLLVVEIINHLVNWR